MIKVYELIKSTSGMKYMVVIDSDVYACTHNPQSIRGWYEWAGKVEDFDFRTNYRTVPLIETSKGLIRTIMSLLNDVESKAQK